MYKSKVNKQNELWHLWLVPIQQETNKKYPFYIKCINVQNLLTSNHKKLMPMCTISHPFMKLAIFFGILYFLKEQKLIKSSWCLSKSSVQLLNQLNEFQDAQNDAALHPCHSFYSPTTSYNSTADIPQPSHIFCSSNSFISVKLITW